MRLSGSTCARCCRQIAAQGLSAAVYTQLSDVEDEVNGLLTFDRRVCKADAARMLEINRKLRF